MVALGLTKMQIACTPGCLPSFHRQFPAFLTRVARDPSGGVCRGLPAYGLWPGTTGEGVLRLYRCQWKSGLGDCQRRAKRCGSPLSQRQLHFTFSRISATKAWSKHNLWGVKQLSIPVKTVCMNDQGWFLETGVDQICLAQMIKVSFWRQE